MNDKVLETITLGQPIFLDKDNGFVPFYFVDPDILKYLTRYERKVFLFIKSNHCKFFSENEVAQAVGLSRGGVINSVKRLEESGIISRVNQGNCKTTWIFCAENLETATLYFYNKKNAKSILRRDTMLQYTNGTIAIAPTPDLDSVRLLTQIRNLELELNDKDEQIRLKDKRIAELEAMLTPVQSKLIDIPPIELSPPKKKGRKTKTVKDPKPPTGKNSEYHQKIVTLVAMGCKRWNYDKDDPAKGKIIGQRGRFDKVSFDLREADTTPDEVEAMTLWLHEVHWKNNSGVINPNDYLEYLGLFREHVEKTQNENNTLVCNAIQEIYRIKKLTLQKQTELAKTASKLLEITENKGKDVQWLIQWIKEFPEIYRAIRKNNNEALPRGAFLPNYLEEGQYENGRNRFEENSSNDANNSAKKTGKLARISYSGDE